MREIKFRAWDEGNKIMHNNVEFIRSGTEGNDWILFKSDKQTLEENEVLANPYFAQQIKLMEYTGLNGKGDVEIYENDVVSNETIEGTVKFTNGCFVVYDKNDDYIILDNCNLKTLEVIGNIYENPELIKDN